MSFRILLLVSLATFYCSDQSLCLLNTSVQLMHVHAFTTKLIEHCLCLTWHCKHKKFSHISNSYSQLATFLYCITKKLSPSQFFLNIWQLANQLFEQFQLMSQKMTLQLARQLASYSYLVLAIPPHHCIPTFESTDQRDVAIQLTDNHMPLFQKPCRQLHAYQLYMQYSQLCSQLIYIYSNMCS